MLIKKVHLKELKSKGLLRSKHPTKQAYRIAIETVDDTSPLVEDMMRHADHCPYCSLKVVAVLKEKGFNQKLFKKEKKH